MLTAVLLLVGTIGVIWVTVWQIRNDKVRHINRQTGLFSMRPVEEAEPKEDEHAVPDHSHGGAVQSRQRQGQR